MHTKTIAFITFPLLLTMSCANNIQTMPEPEEKIEKLPQANTRFVPNIGLTTPATQISIERLSMLLADEYLLYTKLYNYHWNVVGIHFGELHMFFKQHYEQIDQFIDTLAERIRALGGHAPGSMAEFLQLTRLTEMSGKTIPARTMLHNLLADHETLIRTLRTDLARTAELNDMGSNTILNDMLTNHEKMAWMVRAYLQD